MKLVIFDLDQTLVDLLAAHNRTVARVFRELFGVNAKLTDVDFGGRSLQENFLLLAKVKGISEEKVRGLGPTLLKTYEDYFVETLPRDARRNVLPGVVRLLKVLSSTGNVVVLYTGNSKRIVDAVLAAAGLKPFFRFCLYGTEVEHRSDMIGIAMDEAHRLTGVVFSGKDVVVVGDSPRDIEAGKRFGACTLAVATGFHTESVLSAYTPDYIFKDLRDWRRAAQAIEGCGD